MHPLPFFVFQMLNERFFKNVKCESSFKNQTSGLSSCIRNSRIISNLFKQKWQVLFSCTLAALCNYWVLRKEFVFFKHSLFSGSFVSLDILVLSLPTLRQQNLQCYSWEAFWLIKPEEHSFTCRCDVSVVPDQFCSENDVCTFLSCHFQPEYLGKQNGDSLSVSSCFL